MPSGLGKKSHLHSISGSFSQFCDSHDRNAKKAFRARHDFLDHLRRNKHSPRNRRSPLKLGLFDFRFSYQNRGRIWRIMAFTCILSGTPLEMPCQPQIKYWRALAEAARQNTPTIPRVQLPSPPLQHTVGEVNTCVMALSQMPLQALRQAGLGLCETKATLNAIGIVREERDALQSLHRLAQQGDRPDSGRRFGRRRGR